MGEADIHEQLEKYFKLQLTFLHTRQVNDQHNLETLERECDLFDLQWNVHRIRALHLELPTGVPDPMVAFRNA